MTPSERYRFFQYGLIDGVRSFPQWEQRHPDYLRGYEAGQIAHSSALTAFASEIGYDPAASQREGGGK